MAWPSFGLAVQSPSGASNTCSDSLILGSLRPDIQSNPRFPTRIFTTPAPRAGDAPSVPGWPNPRGRALRIRSSTSLLPDFGRSPRPGQLLDDALVVGQRQPEAQSRVQD